MVSPNKPRDLKFDTMNPQWKDKSTVGEVGVHAHRHVNKTKKNQTGFVSAEHSGTLSSLSI